MAMMRLLSVSLLMTLVACVNPTQYTSALSDPGATEYDDRLLGTWYTKYMVDDEEQFFVFSIHSSDNKQLGIVLFGEDDTNVTLTAYASQFQGNVYYNAKLHPGSYFRAFPDADESPHFFLIRVDFVNDNKILLWTSLLLDTDWDRVQKASRIYCGGGCDYYLVDQSRDELRASIRESTPERFFNLQIGPFFRLASVSEEVETILWVHDTRAGCAILSSSPQSTDSFEWSGACIDGKASGEGLLQWKRSNEVYWSYEGTLVDGQPHGPGRCRESEASDWKPCRYNQGELVREPK